MFTKISLRGADEYDALTKARHYYKYLTKAGVAKKAKKSYNKRFRRQTKNLLQEKNYEDM